MSGNDSVIEGLSPKQDILISLLLAGVSTAAAAKETGISEKTAFRWLKQQSFQQAYRKAQQTLFDQALTGLMLKVDRSIATLDRHMSSEETPAASQIRAAQIVLETAISIHKTQQLEQRIAELERLLETRLN